MFYSLFTIPADKKAGRSKPSGLKTVFTCGLIIIWVSLILFAFIAAAEPAWLKNISQLGRIGESRAMKDYGDNFLRQRNYYMAIAQYEKALKIKSDYVGALVNMAIAYNLSGNSKKAESTLRNALNLETKRKGTIYFNLAEMLEKQGRKTEAIDYCRRAIGTEVEQYLVYRKLAVLYFATGQYENALAAFEKTLEIQTDPTAPYFKMIAAEMANYESDEANLPVLEKLLDDGINDAYRENYDRAVIESLNATDPEIAKTYNHLGAIYMLKGQTDKAIEHFRQSLKIWPGNTDARRNLDLLTQPKTGA